MYPDHNDVLSEKAQIFLKEKNDRYYRYHPLKAVMKMLEQGKEIYSLNQDIQPRRIVSIEERGLQNFHEITTFKGSRLRLGSQIQLFIDTFWLPLPEVEYHEYLYEYDLMYDYFFKTYITSIIDLGKRFWAFKLTTEDDTGIVINNLIIRTPSENVLKEEKTAWERANEEVILLGGKPPVRINNP